MIRRSASSRYRHGVTLLLSAALMVAMVAMVAFAVDMGIIVLARTQLQAAADASCMAAAAKIGAPQGEVGALARQYAGKHLAAGKMVELADGDIEFGIWDATTRTFVPTSEQGNAIRVTARRDQKSGGEVNLFFAKVLGKKSVGVEASAVAVANPRDIAFVVDLSGSMNDDTEPVWATDQINSQFGPQGYPNVGSKLMQDLYDDFNFGTYPGMQQYVGEPLGVVQNSYAYAEMTKDNGPLASAAIASNYRIAPADSEAARKQKAYAWIIDNQIAKLMPQALPKPSSTANYAYWERYLDWLMISQSIVPPPSPSPATPPAPKSPAPSPPSTPKPPSPPSPPPAPKPPTVGKALPTGTITSPLALFGPAQVGPLQWASLVFSATSSTSPLGTPPLSRGTLPPNQWSDRITQFNNPNQQSFPSLSSSVAKNARNWIGYRTYAQFMLDHGRDLKPVSGMYTPTSQFSPNCPFHSESTAAGLFRFPPREQPMHASRRALIAAMKVVEDRNKIIPDLGHRDWVSIISFDTLANGGPAVEQALTGDYRQAMKSCTTLQAVGDKGASTATEAGLIAARNHIKNQKEGGQGRDSANKVVVLLTDGMPNLWVSSTAEVDQYTRSHPSSEYYGGGQYWYDAPLMQAAAMQADKWRMYPVGLGLGTDYGFMDRLARLGGTADDNGQSARSTGNPAEYEQRLTAIFEAIINTPSVRLVQ